MKRLEDSGAVRQAVNKTWFIRSWNLHLFITQVS